MEISKHFTLAELTQSPTATAHGISNQPDEQAIGALFAITQAVLQPLRDELGTAVSVTSGYRSPELNRLMGGSKTSQHIRGEAVDFVCADPLRAFTYIWQILPFDQLIWEEGTDERPKWIHVSYTATRGNRRQVFRIRGGTAVPIHLPKP